MKFNNMYTMGGTVVKNLPAIAGDAGLIPGLGRSPGEGNGNQLQYSEYICMCERAHTHTHTHNGRGPGELNNSPKKRILRCCGWGRVCYGR